ncbi:hypothetical protein KR222_002851 [Zaprionus bogoriensis]|nr:hypothetical protein KR222_002851 [Zaprionus bogoriensis]
MSWLCRTLRRCFTYSRAPAVRNRHVSFSSDTIAAERDRMLRNLASPVPFQNYLNELRLQALDDTGRSHMPLRESAMIRKSAKRRWSKLNEREKVKYRTLAANAEETCLPLERLMDGNIYYPTIAGTTTTEPELAELQVPENYDDMDEARYRGGRSKLKRRGGSKSPRGKSPRVRRSQRLKAKRNKRKSNPDFPDQPQPYATIELDGDEHNHNQAEQQLQARRVRTRRYKRRAQVDQELPPIIDMDCSSEPEAQPEHAMQEQSSETQTQAALHALAERSRSQSPARSHSPTHSHSRSESDSASGSRSPSPAGSGARSRSASPADSQSQPEPNAETSCSDGQPGASRKRQSRPRTMRTDGNIFLQPDLLMNYIIREATIKEEDVDGERAQKRRKRSEAQK